MRFLNEFKKHTFHRMKYRLLTLEELEELKPEFIRFLAANHVTADDWTKIQNNDSEKQEKFIELFSDIVLEKVLKKISYLEHREEKSLMIFKFDEKKITLTGISISEDSELDLTNPSTLASLTLNPKILENNKIEKFKTEKPYYKERESEIFDLLQSGALITDDKLFNLLIDL